MIKENYARIYYTKRTLIKFLDMGTIRRSFIEYSNDNVSELHLYRFARR